MLTSFEIAVRKDLREDKSVYPNYLTTFVSKRAARAEKLEYNTTAHIPGFSNSESDRPETPVGVQEMNPNIYGVSTSPGFGYKEGVPTQRQHPLKHNMLAVAIPSNW
jgi:hypothetical protein